ncbi:TIR domain-containing protein [Rhodoferax sp. 4810]|uniref:TIR domain-containing protein n=1 Tax=Thiospirillum jenense TaxID=1653858 RepID=A0A839HD31_9GAMM|nr:TIR domain-containing protein [Rhodoferax jenense]MBB1126050.1 TIR domain-containing protein [Thiospirillum jenense]
MNVYGTANLFSFRYKRDNWRAGIVRNSWVTKDRGASGFFDSAEWEEVKRKTDSAIQAWIDKQLQGTSVTVVLIGADTAGKRWIEYEIKSSHRRGNGVLGIYVHKIKDKDGNTTTKGKNPFGAINYPIYDWIDDDGYNNMGFWIEKAAKIAGK